MLTKDEEKFIYYNHALLPNCHGHESFQFTKEELNIAFRNHKKALLFRYTTSFDCGFETDWWYVINDNGGSINLSNISSKHRRNLKRATKQVYCKEISFDEYKEGIMIIFSENAKRYNHFDHKKEQFNYHSNLYSKVIGCFLKCNNQLIGYELISVFDTVVYLLFEKTDRNYSKYQPSFALNCYIVEKYGNKISYITNGCRNVIHQTNHDNFLIKNCGFRKAYCQLHIVYRSFFILVLIKIIRIFRPVINLLDKYILFHNIGGVLLMDDIARNQRKVFKNV